MLHLLLTCHGGFDGAYKPNPYIYIYNKKLILSYFFLLLLFTVEVQVDGKPLNVTVCDTAGQDVLDPLRQLCYPNTDVFLLCFSVVKPDTFKSIETKWVPELSKNNCSLLLIGTHSDLRDDAKTIQALQASGEKPISVSDAWDLARRIGAKYFETSVYNKEKIKEVFDTVIWDALQAQRKRPPLWKRLLCLT
uniref:CSON011576 protein n=1 Tax=Culicoides sonorensis TaxID=179676 RepID=A0A336KJM2_CULSO